MQNDIDISSRFGNLRYLLSHVWNHFQEDRCLEEAASLSYTSLLSLVPLLAVVFGIVSAFPVFAEFSDKLQEFIFNNMIPAAGEQIVPYLNEFLGSVSSLTLPGMLVLLITALMLMVRIEVSFNRIWRVSKSRSLINRIVMYWAVLTLGPLLIGAALALTATKVMGALGLSDGLSPGFYRFGIFLLSWAVFSMMFLVIPNRPVRIAHALAGAFLSAVLFELAKIGFVGYVSNTNYKVIYGALATIPIFLFWLYLVWIVVLLGASLSASLTTFRAHTRQGGEWPDLWCFQLVYRLLGHFSDAQREGRSLSESDLMEQEKHVSEFQLMKLLARLEQAAIITREQDGDWLLKRDLDEMTLADLYREMAMYLPISEIRELPTDDGWDQAYIEALRSISREGKMTWQRSLRSMYKTENKQ